MGVDVCAYSTGETWQSKIERITSSMDEEVQAVAVTALDEVAWLFNMRGDEIAYNPVFFSYALIDKLNQQATLYLPSYRQRLLDIKNFELLDHLAITATGQCATTEPCVKVKEYDEFFTDLHTLADSMTGKVWVSPMSGYHVFSTVGRQRSYVQPSILRELKGSKNPTEIEGMRTCHKRDSAALIEFMAKLEQEVKAGVEWTEISASDELERTRRSQKYNKGLSFATISASGPNGAVIHYEAKNETNRKLTTDEMYLLDSGGQYLDGTTDVTRTFHFGSPTDFQKEAYTRVLLGAIDLARARWPMGVYGRQLDIIARYPLFQVGLNYRHGTGHGIGAFLNVHEGPGRINFGYRYKTHESKLGENMFFSDEPGYYQDGEFGIRLETIVMTTKVKTEYEFGSTGWLAFEEITFVPFEPHLINYKLFHKDQLDWLNRYHERCQQDIGEEILKPSGKMQAYDWLKSRTAKVTSASGHWRPSWISWIVAMVIATQLIQ